MGRSIGIDLGTTNSVAAFVNDAGQAEVLWSRDSLRYTPSIVSLRPRRGAGGEEELLVGAQAHNNAMIAPKSTIYSFKRLMGRTTDEERVRDARTRLTYEIIGGEGNDRCVRVAIGDKRYTPEDLSAMVLRRIREDADGVFGHGAVTHAVITVPAHFEERQREATRKAGVMAGFHVKMLLDEPIAAAIAHGVAAPAGTKRRLLVLDIGGGTFDMSVVQQADNRFQVLQTGGDMWLGGHDFDDAVIGIIESKVRKEGLSVPEDPRTQLKLRDAAEKAKHKLSGVATTDVYLDGILRDKDKLVDFVCDITRNELDLAITPHMARVEETIRRLLAKENLPPEVFDYALLVGGSSAVPQFRTVVSRILGPQRIRMIADPMECVARGAALVARNLVGVACINRKCPRPENGEDAETCAGCGASLAPARPVFRTDGPVASMMLPIPRALGIACREGSNADAYEILIPVGTPYPMSEARVRTFRLGAGDMVVIPVYEGDNPRASRNHYQGTVKRKPPSALKPGDPVEVGLNYTRNRTLDVTVTYPTLGLTETVQLSTHLVKPDRPSEDDDWSGQLSFGVRIVRSFLDSYAKYIDAGPRRRLEEQLSRAERIVFNLAGDEHEARRLAEALLGTTWEGCGVASALFKAETIGTRVAPSIAAAITKTTNELRAAYEGGDRSQVSRLQDQLQKTLDRERERMAAAGEKLEMNGLLERLPAAK